ncbi:DNA polymerase I [Thiohalophilus thiocyanatoxydans]|uniref:DNA polymerase I n=1 Tax=Thiohalophilus thiocyanatoxydans TaxID=381308 RepID=A0A4R8ISS7_9GAMM|nr:DNA polymerase I [Thiohalophilus thiocyanatoxydans]TDY03678.1 DNA polymerase I [Thiohalophilus thiocyanatoxydans]
MSDKQNKPFILVDGSSYLFRAYHAMPKLTNSSGEATGAIYGVINMIRRLLKDYQPEHIAVVFDAKGKTFRDDLYAEYKANRPPMPDDLAEQIEPIHQIIQAMGLPLLCVPGVEADDVIGTLARQAEAQGIETIISTGDKDMAQLVDAHVTLINTMSGSLSDVEGVKQKFGVGPEQIIDYLALIGDTVDNVPGVPKVGPKTAVKWLQEYGSLEAIMENAEQFKGKVGEYLRDSLDQLPLSRELVTIKCDVDLDVTPETLNRGEPDNAALREFYQRYEFKSWLSDLLGEQAEAGDDNGQAEGGDKPAYETILDQNAFEGWLKRLRAAELFAFDLETTSLNYMEAAIVGCSFAIKPGEAAYLPVAHNYSGAPQQLDRDNVLEQLKPLLEDPRYPKLGQHIKYDMNVLGRYAIALDGVAFDSMLESYVLESTASRHDMDTLALKYLGHKTIHYEDVAGKGAKQVSFDQVDIESASEYAAEDADVTLRLHRTLWPKLEAIPALAKVFKEIEMPLMPVLSRMERRGVKLDVAMLNKQSKQLSKRLKELEQAAHESAGEPFNLGSPKQLQAILFEKQGLPVVSKTAKGQPSTAESVLQELADQGYELPQRVLEWRGLSKLKSTYTDKLPEMIHPDSGRVHTSYQQAVAATGRLSSTEPNLQNIPVRSEEGRRIRKAFVPEKGYRMLAADYSQIELRIMAHLSGDKGLLDAFKNGEDIHRATAAEVFGVELDKVNSEQRRSAKAINFGLIYGMSAFGLGRQLGIDRGQAQEYVNLYFARYPGVKQYMDDIREKAREQGYVETVYGRRLYLPEINTSNHTRRQYAERTAINAPMQGTAADIIKRAMITLDAVIEKEQLPIWMIMQVHDELVFEVREDAVDEATKVIRDNMVRGAELSVPLEVDVGIGDNWDEAH